MSDAESKYVSIWTPEKGGHRVTAERLADMLSPAEWDAVIWCALREPDETRAFPPEVRDRLKDFKLVSFTWAGGTRPDYASLGVNGWAVLDTSRGEKMMSDATQQPTDQALRALQEELQFTRKALTDAYNRIESLLGRDSSLSMRLALLLAGSVEAYRKLAAQSSGLRGGSAHPVIEQATKLLHDLQQGNPT